MDATMEIKRSKNQLPPPDLISLLPDDVLGAIITLLPSADGARTQLLSRRWRPLWRSSPLNLKAKTFAAAKTILDSHRGGPCRRLSLTWHRSSLISFPDPTEEVLRLPGLHGLQEFELMCFFTVPPSAVLFNVPRFSPTLRILSVCCRSSSRRRRLEFPEAAAAFVFPHLEQLTLKGIIVPESTLHGILSRCPSLQSLVLHRNAGYSHLRICSRTLRSLGILGAHQGEVVIEDAPLLERLFQEGPVYRQKIQVIHAPKLKMLGYLRAGEEFVPPNLALEKMELVSLPNTMRTMKILALDVAPGNLDVVIDLLTWFPCLEKLYMALGHSKLRNVRGKSNGVKPFVSLECHAHLKILELKGYRGLMSEVSFVRFFLKNARVLECLKFLVPRKTCYKKWISIQRSKLRRPGARFCFEPEPDHRQPSSCVAIKHIHNLALDDPFDASSCMCPHDDDDEDDDEDDDDDGSDDDDDGGDDDDDDDDFIF